MSALGPCRLASAARSTGSLVLAREIEPRAHPPAHSGSPWPHVAVALHLLSRRGLNMAADLAGTPTTGIRVQACGDCHLLNFGAYATPERRVIFDINDLDETLPAPWEWDVKRLAASFVLACRDNGFSDDTGRDAVLSCVRSYRERMAEYSDMRVLDVWYASIDAEDLLPTIRDDEARQRFEKRLQKAHARSVLEHDFPELVHTPACAHDQGKPAPDLSSPRKGVRRNHGQISRGLLPATAKLSPTTGDNWSIVTS